MTVLGNESLSFRLVHVTHIYTLEKLLTLLRAYYENRPTKLDFNR